MGCHTWFSRPITDKEFEKMKENAPKEIYYLTGDSKKNIEIGLYDKNLYDLLMKSYNENIPCVYGFYWWQLGYGSGIDKTYKEIGKCSKLYTLMFLNTMTHLGFLIIHEELLEVVEI